MDIQFVSKKTDTVHPKTSDQLAMKKLPIQEKLIKCAEQLEDLASRVTHSYGLEEIHRFRLLLKKFRAIVRLMEFEHNRKIQVPKRLKKLNKLLGEIRTLQLQESM